MKIVKVAMDGDKPVVHLEHDGHTFMTGVDATSGQIVNWPDRITLALKDQAQAQITAMLSDRSRRLEHQAHKMRNGSSLQRTPYHSAQHRNARVRKYVGIAHSDPTTTYFSSSNDNTFAYLAIEGDPLTETPEMLDEHIRYVRRIHDERDALVVVAGSLSFMRRYLRALREPDFVVFCSEEPALEELGIEVADRGFAGGESERTLDEILYPEYGIRPAPSFERSIGAPSVLYDSEAVPRAMRPERTHGAVEAPTQPVRNIPENITQPVPTNVNAGRPRFDQRVTRPADTGAGQVVPHAASGEGFAPIPDIPMMGAAAEGFGRVASSGGADAEDLAMAARMRAIATGGVDDADVEVIDEDAVTSSLIVPGLQVRDGAGVKGSVQGLSPDGEMATVVFEDAGVPQAVPTSDLEPAI